MYCSKCGSELPDDAKFCTSCGASTSDDAGKNVNYSDGQVQMNTNGFSAAASAPRKTPKTVFTAVFAVIIVILLGFWAKGKVMRTFMPKTYVKYAISNTANEIADEVTGLQKSILGFEIDENSNFTTALDMHLYDSDADINSKIAYLGSKNKLSFDISAQADGEEASANLFWDNKKIGLAIPKLIDDKYITVDAKNFGKQVYDSDFKDARDYVSEDADISFENIFKKKLDQNNYKDLGKKLKKEFSRLVKSGKITDKDKTDIEIDGKNKKAVSTEIRFEGSDIKDCLLNCIDIIESDKEFSEAYSTVKGDVSIKDAIDELKDEIKDTDFDGSIDIKFLTYKDYLVGIEFENDDEDATVSFTFNSVKNMLDLWQIKIESGSSEVRVRAEGNIIPVKNAIDYIITVKEDGKYSSVDGKISLSANLNNGDFRLKVFDDGDEEFSIGGECSNKKGFKVSFKNDYFRAELSVNKGAKFNKVSGLKEYMIFEHTEDEIQDEFEKYEDNFDDISNVLEAVFDIF